MNARSCASLARPSRSCWPVPPPPLCSAPFASAARTPRRVCAERPDEREPALARRLSFGAFLGAFACTVGAWRSALSAAGARLCPKQAAARLGIGSMVNSFTPAKLGDAVKITLCARAIDAPDRLWTASGTYAALAAARSLTLAGLVVAASATHALPIWPVFVLVGTAAACRARGSRLDPLPPPPPQSRASSPASRSLAKDRRALRGVALWTIGMQLFRLAGTVAAVYAFGLPHPLLAALVILPALDLAGAVPLTPGSFGVGGGAVAVALASRGIGMTDALATGLAIQGVETLVSVTCGIVRARLPRCSRASVSAALGDARRSRRRVGRCSPHSSAWSSSTWSRGRAGTPASRARRTRLSSRWSRACRRDRSRSRRR